MDVLQQVQQMTMKIIKGWESFSYETRLRKVEFSSLEKRRLIENLVYVYGHKFKYRKLPLNRIILLRGWSNTCDR